MPSPPPRNREITLTFSTSDLAQLEAFATLHGVSVAAFIQQAALEAAHIATSATVAEDIATENGASWMSDILPPTSSSSAASEIFGRDEVWKEGKAERVAPALTIPAPVSAPISAPVASPSTKRGVVGEPSQLAKGQGPVWEIRRALGRERVHGLGWTREHLAFVLKLSVVGVRKMERMGTSPVKSLEARAALLKLAQTLEEPTSAIKAYIEAEIAAIGDGEAG